MERKLVSEYVERLFSGPPLGSGEGRVVGRSGVEYQVGGAWEDRFEACGHPDIYTGRPSKRAARRFLWKVRNEPAFDHPSTVLFMVRSKRGVGDHVFGMPEDWWIIGMGQVEEEKTEVTSG